MWGRQYRYYCPHSSAEKTKAGKERLYKELAYNTISLAANNKIFSNWEGKVGMNIDRKTRDLQTASGATLEIH